MAIYTFGMAVYLLKESSRALMITLSHRPPPPPRSHGAQHRFWAQRKAYSTCSPSRERCQLDVNGRGEIHNLTLLSHPILPSWPPASLALFEARLVLRSLRSLNEFRCIFISTILIFSKNKLFGFNFSYSASLLWALVFMKRHLFHLCFRK